MTTSEGASGLSSLSGILGYSMDYIKTYVIPVGMYFRIFSVDIIDDNSYKIGYHVSRYPSFPVGVTDVSFRLFQHSRLVADNVFNVIVSTDV